MSVQSSTDLNLLTSEQLCLSLQITPRALTQLTENRSIPFIKLGKEIRFRAEEVVLALEKLTIQPMKKKALRPKHFRLVSRQEK